MYKKIIAAICLVGIFFVTGCGNETKTLTCTIDTNVQDGVDMKSTYKVTYKGDNVSFVESEEKIISEDKKVLETFETAVKNQYSPYDGVEHYDYSVNIDGNTLTSIAKIDYEKIDTDKMIEIDSKNKTLIKNGKIKVSDLKAGYEALGATCKEE